MTIQNETEDPMDDLSADFAKFLVVLWDLPIEITTISL